MFERIQSLKPFSVRGPRSRVAIGALGIVGALLFGVTGVRAGGEEPSESTPPSREHRPVQETRVPLLQERRNPLQGEMLEPDLATPLGSETIPAVEAHGVEAHGVEAHGVEAHGIESHGVDTREVVMAEPRLLEVSPKVERVAPSEPVQIETILIEAPRPMMLGEVSFDEVQIVTPVIFGVNGVGISYGHTAASLAFEGSNYTVTEGSPVPNMVHTRFVVKNIASDEVVVYDTALQRLVRQGI